ncbi:MAG: cobalamin B12-binding domain-containing protein [Deltaproteobacteria bacterium]|nr:MAG: cobalamin B12-binding domain-containing protein [Deltaproteobacteria bacterium]
MHNGKRELQVRLRELVKNWNRVDRAFPSHSELESTGRMLLKWKISEKIKGLWDDPPLLVSATLDDGLGQGLRIINLFSEVAGLTVIPIGLLQPPEKIIDVCNMNSPDILGLTVLQFDSEEMILKIRREIDPKIQIIAGGPVFAADSEFAERTGVDFVAKNVASFLEYLFGDVGSFHRAMAF